jgi:hypothetical protein
VHSLAGIVSPVIVVVGAVVAVAAAAVVVGVRLSNYVFRKGKTVAIRN